MPQDSELEHLDKTIKDAREAAKEEHESRPFDGGDEDVTAPEQGDNTPA
jgi:hypothetical protein